MATLDKSIFINDLSFINIKKQYLCACDLKKEQFNIYIHIYLPSSFLLLSTTIMGKKQTKIVPQFTVTIVINGEAIVAIDVCEDATLKDARKEILLESKDFPNLPSDYHFRYKGFNIYIYFFREYSLLVYLKIPRVYFTKYQSNV